MGKTIFNNLKNEVKSLIKSLCESHSNNTNDIINIINKNQIKEAINKIVSDLVDLDNNVCINKIIKRQYIIYYINIISYIILILCTWCNADVNFCF